MRVLHVIPELSIRSGGLTRACAEACESLSRLGLQVSLLAAREWEEGDFSPQGVELHFCRRFPGRLAGAFAYSAELRSTLRRLVPQADLVHIHGVWKYPGLAAAQEALRHSVPYIVQPHGSLAPWKLRYKRWRKKLYGRLVERRLLQDARAIHAESEEDKKQILDYLPGLNVFVVPCGAYAEKLAAPARCSPADRWPELGGRRFMLYLARLDVNKGIDLLLQAFHLAQAGEKGWRLLIVGPDWQGTRRRMERLARKLKVADAVLWAGMVGEEDRRVALHGCDFYVLPTLEENFGISILEALLCGRPVITSTATPWRRLAEIGAGIAVSPAAGPLSAVLNEWMQFPKAQLDNMGQQGYRFAAREFDWNSVAARQAQAYRAILDGKAFGLGL
jgi:glycosyltransferase involved in cell wall biosynthesis